MCVLRVQRRRLPELHQNQESVGELWLGLLRFYTEEFDFKEHVISIRQHKRLTTFEKQWTSKCIAIEGLKLIVGAQWLKTFALTLFWNTQDVIYSVYLSIPLFNSAFLEPAFSNFFLKLKNKYIFRKLKQET